MRTARRDADAAHTPRMGQFVLVHGSGQNASCWERVRACLHARGHVTRAPDLPKAAADWGLVDHAHAVADAFDDPQTIVVAHSLCGALLPLVRARRPCRLLVYLAAVIPKPGLSVREQFAADATMFDPAWIAAGARWHAPDQRESLAREFLFHDCEEAALPWSLHGIEPIDSRGIITEPAPHIATPGGRAMAIVATRDRTLSPAWCAARCRDALGCEPLALETGHCPQNSNPQALAELLDTVAAD